MGSAGSINWAGLFMVFAVDGRCPSLKDCALSGLDYGIRYLVGLVAGVFD
jgi:hypothetical protein